MMPKGVIEVDTHEPESMRQYLIDRDWKIEVKSLKVGDYVRGDTCIERKKIGSDFISSIRNGRLWKQLRDVRENYTYPYLAVSGVEHETRNWKDEKTAVTVPAKVTRHDSFDIRVVRASHDRNLADAISTVLQDRTETHRPSRITRAAKDMSEVKENVLMGVKGVGIKTSQKVLKHFDTLVDFAEACRGSPEEVGEAVSNHRAKRLVEAFTSED